MVALLASLIALLAIAAFAGAGIVHERWLLLSVYGLPRRFRCGFCGYSLAGIDSETCPECGKPRGVIAQLDQRHRLKAAVWFIPMLFAALLGLVTSAPGELVALALAGSAFGALVAVAGVRVPMAVFFAVTAAGLALAVLAGLGHHESAHSWGAGIVAFLSLTTLTLGNAAAYVVHRYRTGPIHADRPPKDAPSTLTSSSPSESTPPPPPPRDPTPGSAPSSN